MAQSSTISTRISLEGAEEIRKQLADLGKGGEQALKQIQDAASGAHPGLSALNAAAASVHAGFARVGEALSPLRARFGELSDAASAVGNRLTSIASIFGFGFVAGIAGGVAGFAALVKGAASAGHELQLQSDTLGLTVEQLQVYRKLAAAAGVDADQLFNALAKLAQNVGKAHEELNQSASKVLQSLPLAGDQAGAGVLRGIKPAADAIKTITSNIQGTSAAAAELAPILLKTLPPDLASKINLNQLIQELATAGREAGKTGEEFRLFAAQLGVNFPTLNFGEQFKRQAELAKDPLRAVGVSLKDLQDAGDNFQPIILKVVDGLSKLTNPTEQLRIGTQLLGRGYKDLVQTFDGGAEAIERVTKAAQAQGFLLTKEQVALLADADRAFVALGGSSSLLRNQLALVFAPALTESLRSFSQFIKDNAATLREWAQVIADQALPGIQNLIRQFTGVPKQQPLIDSPEAALGQSGANADNIRAKFSAIITTVEGVRVAVVGAFTAINVVLTGVAGAINSVFGTNFTASGVAVVVVIGLLTGAFTLLIPLLALAGAAIAFIATPIGLAVAAIGLIVGAIVNWRSNFEALGNWLRGAGPALVAALTEDFRGLRDNVLAFGGAISTGFQSGITGLSALVGPPFAAIRNQIVAWTADISALLTPLWQVAIVDPFNFAQNLILAGLNILTNGFRSAADSILGILTPVWDLASRIGRAASSVLGGGGGGGAASSTGSSDAGNLGIESDFSGGTPGGFAAGGQVFGPPGRDRVPAMLTEGEFVLRTEAVRHYGTDILHALNQMMLPLTSVRGYSLGGFVDAIAQSFAPMPAPLMLAGGGAVAGGGPSNVLNLTIGTEQFQGLMAPGAVYDRLARHARATAVRSAGRKPGWVG